jgi:hypothetical protein
MIASARRTTGLFNFPMWQPTIDGQAVVLAPRRTRAMYAGLARIYFLKYSAVRAAIRYGRKNLAV